MDKVKIFMSDLHIGDSGKADDFTKEKEKVFVKLLEHLADKFGTKAELILLGDIFDLIEQEETDPQKAIVIAMDKHGKAIEALNGWLKKGNKLFYITGNHDHALRRANVSKLLAKKVLNNDSSPNEIPWGSFVVDDWYASPNFSIYAEHGNRFDADNNHGGKSGCFGDKIVREVLRPLEVGKKNYLTDKAWTPPEGVRGDNPFVMLDNVRPRGNIIFLIEKLIDEGYLNKKAKDDLKDFIIDIYKKHPELGKIGSMVLNNKFLRWALITDAALREKLNTTYRTYREHAKTMIMKQGLTLRDLSFRPRYIVMGHTHYFDSFDLNKSTKYLNLSSWLDTVFLNENGEIDKVRFNCPFLVFYKTGDEVSYKFYDSNLDNEIEWKLIENDIKKYSDEEEGEEDEFIWE